MDIETVRMFSALTSGRFDVYCLAGPDRKRDRAALMARILGVPKVPVAKSGINAIYSEMARRLDVRGDCLSARYEDLANKCRAILAA